MEKKARRANYKKKKGMQQAAVFCKELTPTKTEHLMNRARKELDKLKKVTKIKIAERIRSSPEQEQSKSKEKVDVSSLVKAKKNEMCVSEENDLEISKMKKKKKHKSKSKDYACESELNNTLSLGLHVNIELANSANENDVALNPRHIITILKKHSCQDSALRLKEKTEKTKSDENKIRKSARLSNAENVFKTGGKELAEEIAGNQENSDKTVIKTDKRKKHKSADEFEETVCITKRSRKKSRRESSPLEESICTEKMELQYKRHKKGKNHDDSTFQLEEREKEVLGNNLLEMETEDKNKRKKKKHKDIQSEGVHKDSEERKHKNHKKDEEEPSIMNSSDTTKKTKKKKIIELTESLEDSHSEVYCNESKSKKHNHSKNTENLNESLTLDSSQMGRVKKKKHKHAKESDMSVAKLKDNTEETSIIETESYCTSKSPNKRKHAKHKTGTFEQEVQDAEIYNNTKRKQKVGDISNVCVMNKQRKKKHKDDSEEFAEQVESKKKRKTKSTEEEVMQKESKHVKEGDEFTELSSKSTKRKKRDRVCKDVENMVCSSENIQEINESALFLGQGKKVKRKKRLLNESDEMQNVLFESEHQMENMLDVDSVVVDQSSEQMEKHGEESIVTTSDCENGQIKKKKAKKSKCKERERGEINSEVTLSEIDCESISQIFSSDGTSLANRTNKTFGRSPMERLLYGDPDSMMTETCTHCTQCSHDVTAKPSPSVPPVVNTVNVKQDMTRTPKLQDLVKKPCIVQNIVNTIVIKREPGLETENSNSEVTEPINFIDINNLKIKQEPGLETETPPDQAASDPIQLKLPPDHVEHKVIKKEPSTEAPNNLSAAVPSIDMPVPEVEQQLQHIKKEYVEQLNTSTDGPLEDASNAPTKDEYLHSTVAGEDGASKFFRHAPTSTDNTTASEHQSVCVGNIPNQKESPSTSGDIPPAEFASNVPDNAGYVTTFQNWDLSKQEVTSKEASLNSETSLVQIRRPPTREEWVYELHMVDVPYKVHFHQIARYFRIPVSKIREYSGYGRRPGYKHVVVSLNHYTTCLRMSKKRRLFGSKHTFIWSFKKYTSQDS